MIYSVTAPQNISVLIDLPASKSISNRALILNALSKSQYAIENLSDSDDTRVMLKAFESSESEIDIGAAGTSMRFLTAYFSQLEGKRVITGTERMKNRPIRILVDALQNLGAEINYLEKDGFPPLEIHGKLLRGGEIFLDGGVSSQYISALMMIAPYMENGIKITLQSNVISQPYIKMTIRLMKIYGVEASWDDSVIGIEPQFYKPCPFKVESDWSGASYWYEIMALSPESSTVELTGLMQNSLQGDSRCAFLFDKLGVKTIFTEEGVFLKKQAVIVSRLDYDFVNEPDLVQTFVTTCCFMNIPFRFTGLQSLRIKETDRISALQTEMKKLGFLIKAESDTTMEWEGEKCDPEPDPLISTYEDHRMAMAFAPLCLKTGKIRINEPKVVSKSYPNFWKDLEKTGFKIEN